MNTYGMNTNVPSHTHTINYEYYNKTFSPSLQLQEPVMTAADRLAKEKREQQEEAEAATKWSEIEFIIGMPRSNGTILTWTVDDKHSCAVLNDDQWWTTDGRRHDTPGLVAHLINTKVGVDSLRVHDGS